MFSSGMNQVLLITCLFVLFYTALHAVYMTRDSNTWIKSYSTILLIAMALALVAGIYLLLEVTDATGFLFFSLYLSLILACSINLLSRCVKKINKLDAARKHSALDALTGVYNRQYIEDRLEAEISRSRRYSSPLAVVAVDIGDFHRFNSTYGFQSGDLLLKTAASIIASSIRESDAAARYNAKCFIVLLTNTPESSISTVTERLRSKLAEGFQTVAGATRTYSDSNVKFGKAWCDLSTRSGIELINMALEQIQDEKCSLNKQDTSGIPVKSDIKTKLEQAA